MSGPELTLSPKKPDNCQTPKSCVKDFDAVGFDNEFHRLETDTAGEAGLLATNQPQQ